uniref:Uncharacterized protein n=1 Tax=Rhizophora mucronata TaxID=61149 RepID=A0A2P2QV14_RHIMU
MRLLLIEEAPQHIHLLKVFHPNNEIKIFFHFFIEPLTQLVSTAYGGLQLFYPTILLIPFHPMKFFILLEG